MKLPEFKPVKKPNPVKRIGVAVLVVLGVGGGIYAVSQLTKGPTPDEWATTLTNRIASDVVIVISGQDDDGSAGRRTEMAIVEIQKESGCEFIGGTAALGNTPEGAIAHAERLIEEARTATASDTQYEYGFGYTVVRGVEGTTIQGRKAILPAPYVVVLAALRCGQATPASPPGLSS